MSQPPPSPPATFEQSLAELEAIVRQLEEGDLGLNEALSRYEQGVRRLKECYQLLQGAQRRIELLQRVGEDGEAVAAPFDDTASLDESRMELPRPPAATDVDSPRELF